MTQGFTHPFGIPVPVSQGGTGVTSSTGSGSNVLNNAPTLITPSLGVASATSLAFSPTTGGILATTNGDNASSSVVGNVIKSIIVAASPVTFSSGVAKDLTFILLTPGDWDIYGNIFFTGTTTSACDVWISTVSATEPDNSAISYSYAGGAFVSANAPFFSKSVSSNTNVYLSGIVAGTGTLTGCGGIYARLRR